jgi:hypothetical protein
MSPFQSSSYPKPSTVKDSAGMPYEAPVFYSLHDYGCTAIKNNRFPATSGAMVRTGQPVYHTSSGIIANWKQWVVLPVTTSMV